MAIEDIPVGVHSFFDVKPLPNVDHREVTEGTSEHSDEVSYESRDSAIGVDVHFHDVECDGESEEEDSEQDHKVADFSDHCNEHSNQEVELAEDTNEVHHLYQTEKSDDGEQDLHLIVHIVFIYVPGSSKDIEEAAHKFEVVPWVKQVVLAIDLHLYELIKNEEALYEEARRFAEEEQEVLVSGAILTWVVDALEVDVVEDQEDDVEHELEEEEVAGIVLPLEVDYVLNGILLK
mmetsp:Transcript_26614/g.40621  ORF Transcript_26614/g.40621 Transcript_26614/m.40621 type:complete len:234 (+) Transcript_26614:2700-3401(+)|eukprot:CAMPEP_0170510774 /NCGR_PEP_ID=MMETSP0208-20121228/65945_1 /TAXON_ID=197538 /ORGANISM="Strombidium inclinatum, Strain S3" /LENGTH=233 /DNA_ID=CAMNT_0010794261 /DNA_START=2659 /DNA_END=3360 /DNA_ORIENTATION=-